MKICNKHGELNESNSYNEKCSRTQNVRIRCRQCKLEKDLTYRKKNRENLVEKNMAYKAKNRHIINEWSKQDRKNNPEKYRKYEENYIKKYGIDHVRKYEVARIHGLTIVEYEELIKKHNNLCAICNKEEKRISRNGEYITPLCVDHCHVCEEKGTHVIRGLLCHSCNTAIGKFADDIELIKKAILYLDKHKHIE